MLPGRRTFTDDDIVTVLSESLTVFQKVVEEWAIPDDLRIQIFAHCVNMVGQRTLLEGFADVLQ